MKLILHILHFYYYASQLIFSILTSPANTRSSTRAGNAEAQDDAQTEYRATRASPGQADRRESPRALPGQHDPRAASQARADHRRHFGSHRHQPWDAVPDRDRAHRHQPGHLVAPG